MKTFTIFKRGVPSELNLRKEMNETLFGSDMEIAKGQTLIFRRMRRKDEDVYPIKSDDLMKCDCQEGRSGQPNRDYRCPICDGEGYLFDDHFIVGYKMSRFEYQDVEKHTPFGKSTVGITFFYTETDHDYSRFDKIVEVFKDTEGKLTQPTRHQLTHNIHMAQAFRSDNGRTEYWRLNCYSE